MKIIIVGIGKLGEYLAKSLVKEHHEVTLIDIDFTEYRRKNDMKTVRRNVSLPSWLDLEAEKAGINVSALLQAALKKELKIDNI